MINLDFNTYAKLLSGITNTEKVAECTRKSREFLENAISKKEWPSFKELAVFVGLNKPNHYNLVHSLRKLTIDDLHNEKPPITAILLVNTPKVSLQPGVIPRPSEGFLTVLEAARVPANMSIFVWQKILIDLGYSTFPNGVPIENRIIPSPMQNTGGYFIKLKEPTVTQIRYLRAFTQYTTDEEFLEKVIDTGLEALIKQGTSILR